MSKSTQELTMSAGISQVEAQPPIALGDVRTLMMIVYTWKSITIPEHGRVLNAKMMQCR